MEVLFERVAGLDIGKATLTACCAPRDRGVGAGRRARSRR